MKDPGLDQMVKLLALSTSVMFTFSGLLKLIIRIIIIVIGSVAM